MNIYLVSMSNYSLQVPEGLKKSHCEKPGSDYHDVPIRYIMPQIMEDEVRTTSIKLPDRNIMKLTVFDEEMQRCISGC